MELFVLFVELLYLIFFYPFECLYRFIRKKHREKLVRKGKYKPGERQSLKKIQDRHANLIFFFLFGIPGVIAILVGALTLNIIWAMISCFVSFFVILLLEFGVMHAIDNVHNEEFELGFVEPFNLPQLIKYCGLEGKIASKPYTTTNIELQKEIDHLVRYKLEKAMGDPSNKKRDLLDELLKVSDKEGVPLFYNEYNEHDKREIIQNYKNKIEAEESKINNIRRENYEKSLQFEKEIRLYEPKVRSLPGRKSMKYLGFSYDNVFSDQFSNVKKNLTGNCVSKASIKNMLDEDFYLRSNYPQKFDTHYDSLSERVKNSDTANALYEKLVFLMVKKDMWRYGYLTSIDMNHGTIEEENEKRHAHVEKMKKEYPWLYTNKL